MSSTVYFFLVKMENRNFEIVEPLWKPDESNGKILKGFKKRIAEKYNVQTENYWDLYDWSLDHITELWAEIWDYSGIIYSKSYDKVVDLSIPIEKLPSWFEGAELNLAENLLKYRDDEVALILAGEDMETEQMTFFDLFKEVEVYAAAFRKFGLKKGDRVVCQMSNRKEAVIAMIAVTSIGAIWSGALPLIGAGAVLNRFKQIEPRIFLTVDRISNDKQVIDMLPKMKDIVEGLPSLEKVVIVAAKEESYLRDISEIRNSCFLNEFLELGKEKDGSVPPIQFEQVSFDHPIFINYTSGTTGLPKPLVHGIGYLLSIFRDFSMHFDAHRGSVYFSMSPVGWATWNCFSSLLFAGITLVMYEGVPYFMSPTYFWDMVDEFKMTHVFIPSSVLDEFQKRGYLPTKNHSLESLKFLMSGGSVVKSQLFDFVYSSIKKDVAFSSLFGSTEFLGSCLLFESTLPVYKGEISTRGLGVDLEIVDDTGKPLIGKIGELVVSKAMPNFPLGLWKDTDGSLLREKYLTKFPGKFDIGDYGMINPITRGLIICGRSDETLKQRGCRFGSSEIYNIVELFPEVRDSLCVSLYNKTLDEKAVLFIKLREGFGFSENLVSRIREAITRELTARHVPDIILDIKDIPYNANGKKMEITVKKLINRLPYNAETIANPESLKYFENLTGLQEF